MTKIDNISETLSKADVLRANTSTLAGRVFSVPLCDLPFVFTNDQYLAWCRSFLGLPPASTIGNPMEQKGFDYPCRNVCRCIVASHSFSTLMVVTLQRTVPLLAEE